MPPRPELRAEQLHGYKYFDRVAALLERLHHVGTHRDRARNRTLFYDQYAALILLYFFNPVLTSLRGLQQATTFEKVQKRLGVRRVSLGSLSEASAVFDPACLRELVVELAARVAPAELPADREALRHLTAVDGTLLPALPRMAWALWQDDAHRAAKVHLHFEVGRGIPVDATVTPGTAFEVDELRTALQPGRLYVLDRGYARYQLMAAVLAAESSFLVRLRADTALRFADERPLTPAARAAGVVRDGRAELGPARTPALAGRRLRVVVVATGKALADGTPETLTLATDRLDLPADLVALGYRQRWHIELYFRWLKCILGCRHLLGHDLAAVQIQVYVALLACLLLTLATGRKPSKRTFEMVCFYLSGWVTEDEFQHHLDALPDST